MKLRYLLLCGALFCGLQSHAQNARVQIIHNAPDPLLSSIDVWVDTMKVLSDFAFRDATPFLELPGSTLMQLRVSPSGSTDTSTALFRKAINLGAGENYYAIANGVMDTASIDPNPNGISTRFDIDLIPQARDSSQVAGNMQLRYRHGIPDYDSMSVRISGQLNFLVDPQLYRQTTDWLTIPAALYTFTAYRGSSYDEVFNFQVLLSTFSDSALFFTSSGLFSSLIDTTLPHMGVLVVTSGGRQAFYEGFLTTSIKQALNAPGWSVYPNPIKDGRIRVQGPAGLTANSAVEVIDAHGRKVLSSTVPIRDGSLVFDKGTLDNGLYLLKIQAKDQVFTSRIKL